MKIEETHTALVHDMWAALSRGDKDRFLGYMADDVHFTMMGNTRYSGLCKGKDEFIKKLAGPITERLDGLCILPERMIAQGEYVVCQSKGTAKTKSGEAYEQHYCQIIRIVDGKVHEVVEYLDTELVTALLT